MAILSRNSGGEMALLHARLACGGVGGGEGEMAAEGQYGEGWQRR